MLSALGGPYLNANTITPSDGGLLPQTTSAIYIGGSGNLKVGLTPVQGVAPTPVTFTGLVVGTVLQIRATQVYSTGTTATNLLALY